MSDCKHGSIPSHCPYCYIAKLEAERDYLLERVIVDDRGIALPCGSTKADKEENIKWLRQALKEMSDVV